MNFKTTALKLATLGTLAAAFIVASPAKADAQVSFGIRVGRPVVYPYAHARPYYAPPAYGYGYYGRPYYGYDRHEAYIRHEERERYDHRFYGR